jgi:hypothetical protein
MNIRPRLAGQGCRNGRGVAGSLVVLAEPAEAAIVACTTYRVRADHYVPTAPCGYI